MNPSRLLIAFACLAFLASCAPLQPGPAPVLACPKQSPAELSAYQNALGPLSDSDTLLCALAVLRQAQDSPLNRTALGSRLYLHLAERETDPRQREHYAAAGVKSAEAAFALGAKNDGAVHYYLAANLGLLVREQVTLAVQNLGRLAQEMRLAVALSPGLDEGGPLRLLGALYLKAPAWPDGMGDLDQALALLERAANEYPRHPINHLFYAQALWSEGDETHQAQARTAFSLGQKLLAEGDWGYSNAAWAKEFAVFAEEMGMEEAQSHLEPRSRANSRRFVSCAYCG